MKRTVSDFYGGVTHYVLTLFVLLLTAASAWAGSKPVCNLEVFHGRMYGIYLKGWAYDPDEPNARLQMHIRVYENNKTYTEITYNTYIERSDVNVAYKITGYHGFDDILPLNSKYRGNCCFEIEFCDVNGDGSTTITGNVEIGAESLPRFTGSRLELTPESMDYRICNDCVITGTGGPETCIVIEDGVTVKLANVDITHIPLYGGVHFWAGLTCLGNATIVLAGGTRNYVRGGSAEYPGIQPGPRGTTLTIRGYGSLEATSYGYAAGIGSGWHIDCGNIVIESGIISATAGFDTWTGEAAGIGAGRYGSCGNISITGGTVSALSKESAGIGSCEHGVCGNISITGGTVNATGHQDGAGIGSDANGTCGNIFISGSLTNVTAKKGYDAPYSIGPGKSSDGAPSACGAVTIGGEATGPVEQSPYTYAPTDATFTVSFDKNVDEAQGTMASMPFTSNTPQPLTVCAFTRPGYDFKEWNTQADGSGYSYTDQQTVNNLGDVTLYAQWALATYNITYLLDEGVNAAGNPATYTYVSDAITLADPTRIGFIFDGWTFEGQDTPIKRPTIATGSYGDKTFTAHWTLDPIVTLTADMGSVKLYSGHTLKGTGGANTRVTIADGATVTLSGVTITDIAYDRGHHWAAIACQGNATIILAEGTVNTLKGGFYAAAIQAGPSGTTLTIQGSGTLNATGGSYNYSDDGSAAIGCGSGYSSNSCGNIVISGGTVNATGGDNSAAIGAGMGTYCGNITINNTVTSVTATAGRKSPNSIGNGTMASCGTVTIGGTVTGSIAQSPVTYNPSNTTAYTVSFNKNASDAKGSMGNQQFSANQPKALSACAFTRDGYIFTGWNTEANGSGTAYTNKQAIFATATMTLYAQWREPYQFTLTFDANGGTGTMEPQTFYEGQAQNLNQRTFTNSGYVFAVWNTQADGNGTTYTNGQSITIDSDMTLYAQWMVHVATTVTLKYETGNVTLYDGDILMGTGGRGTHVTIADGATVMLSNVYINTDYDITCEGDANIIIKSNNNLISAYNSCIYVPSGHTLTISGSGMLTAKGGDAGICGGGNIVIEGGTITATADSGAGIGSGFLGSCGDITIGSGVTKVIATCGEYSMPIGKGERGSCGRITIAPGLVDVTSGNTRTIAAPATAPTITVQPAGIVLTEGYDSGNELTIEATAAAGHTLSYQWYSNTASSTSDGTLIDGATAAVYAVPTGKTMGTTEYYYCIVTATRDDNGQTNTATSDVATVTITPPDVSGSGTEQDPYVINSAKGLRLMAERVNGGMDGYASAWYELGADISFDHGTAYNERNFDGIGLYDDVVGVYQPFNGHFNGKGHTVSGIRVFKGGKEDSDGYKGLFGWIGSGAEVKNVTLRDARITGHTAVGGIVGMNSGTVSGCHVGDDVVIHALAEDASDHGGIAGYNNGIVENCMSAATVSIDDGSTFGYTNGPAGCKFYGAIAGYNYEGELRGNLALGATVAAAFNDSYGAIAGYSNSHRSMLGTNYYSNCTVGSAGTVATSAGVGEYYVGGDIAVEWLSDIATFDGAVPALRNDADNSTALRLLMNMPATLDLGFGTSKCPVTLSGRTLFTDGGWNTLCLPFDVVLEGSPLEGFTVMELDTRTGIYSHDTGLDGQTLYLNFRNATSIQAGQPYIVRKEGSGGIEAPTFRGVTVSPVPFTSVASSDGTVTFVGSYNPVELEANDKSVLFLGSDNTLYWPNKKMTVGAFRAVFRLSDAAATAREFRLSFGEDTQGIKEMEDGRFLDEPSGEAERKIENEAGAWFDLNGRRLSGKPTARGIYIHNGHKVVVK